MEINDSDIEGVRVDNVHVCSCGSSRIPLAEGMDEVEGSLMYKKKKRIYLWTANLVN